MLVMFVGNMTLTAQTQIQVNQTPGYEFIPFGNRYDYAKANYVIPNTNTVFTVLPFGVYVTREAKGVERVFNSNIKLSDQVFGVAGDYNNKSVAVSSDGYAYVVDRTTGSTSVAFKALTSFYKVQSVFGGITTLGDLTKVYISGTFDSIVGRANTPKYLLCYDMVTGLISDVIEDQPFSVSGITKFKDEVFVVFGYDSKLNFPPVWIKDYNPVTKISRDVKTSNVYLDLKLATNGTSLLGIGYKQGFVSCLFQYDESVNDFYELYSGVYDACAYKNEYYLNTSEFIKNTRNEIMQVNKFAKYNSETKEISSFNAVRPNDVDLGNMIPAKDYLIFAGSQPYRLQPVAVGLDYKNASLMQIPNPLPSTYTLQVPTDLLGSTLMVTDLKGSVVLEKQMQGDLDLNLQPGMYIVQINRNDNTCEYRKIIVR